VASVAQRSGAADAPQQFTRRNGDKERSRLLPVLAVERLIRAVLLIGVGLILLTHMHTDWADVARGFVAGLGLTRVAMKLAG
jgi:glyoxylase-like metal-dependent hydrolase (beta-lactamase superfamily II)